MGRLLLQGSPRLAVHFSLSNPCLCLILAGMWHYQLSAGPRSKWDCPALFKSQMMRGVLRGFPRYLHQLFVVGCHTEVERAPGSNGTECAVSLRGQDPWTGSSGSAKRRIPGGSFKL